MLKRGNSQWNKVAVDWILTSRNYFFRVQFYINEFNILTNAKVWHSSDQTNWVQIPLKSGTTFFNSIAHFPFKSHEYRSLKLDLDKQIYLLDRVGFSTLSLKHVIPNKPTQTAPAVQESPKKWQRNAPLALIAGPVEEKKEPAAKKNDKGVLFRQKLITTDSPFHEGAQYLAEKYYLKPYPNDQNPGRIPRFHHGATHVAAATLTVDNLSVMQGINKHVDAKNKTYHGGLIIEFLKVLFPNQYWEIINSLNDGQDLREEDFLLLKYAVFCHDIANTAEAFKDEQAHADIFSKEMTLIGFPAGNIKKFAFAIANKDGDSPNLLQMLIHEADFLEFSRILNWFMDFDINYSAFLPLFKKPEDLDVVVAIFNQIALHYFNLMQHIYRNDKIHEACEFADNCYLETARQIQLFRTEQTKSLLVGISPNFDVSAISILDPLALYLPGYNPQLVRHFSTELDDDKEDNVLELYRTQGLYMRRLQYAFHHEAEVLEKNKGTLDKQKIATAAELKKYFTSNKIGQPPLLPGFTFRPSSFIKQGWATLSFSSNNSGILINPLSPSVLVSHFFKDNVNSYLIGNANFFPRPNHIKDTGSREAASKKMTEREERRCGLTWDNYNKHFGHEATYHSELFLTYYYDAIIGIVVANNPTSAKHALNTMLMLKKHSKKNLSFYYYDVSFDGLTKISVATVLAWAGIHKSPLENPPQFNRDEYVKKLAEQKIEFTSVPPISLQSNTVTDITCSLTEHDPSPQHPIRYAFKCGKHLCEAFVEDGIPIIMVNQKKYYDAFSLLPSIATEYQTRLVQRCNKLLQNQAIEKKLGIMKIQLQITSDQRQKQILNLHYESVVNATPATVLEALDYPLQDCKWEIAPNPLKKSGTTIRLSVMQALDRMHNKLVTLDKDLVLSPKPGRK